MQAPASDVLAQLTALLAALISAFESAPGLYISIAFAAATALVALGLLVGVLRRQARKVAIREILQRDLMDRQQQAASALEEELVELKGRLAVMAEITMVRQNDLASELNARLDKVSDRLVEGLDSVSRRVGTSLEQIGSKVGQNLDGVSERLGTNLVEAERRTSSTLTELSERLAVIDSAQRNIADLSTQVVTLQNVLTNKQARGAFGQAQMEVIVADALPAQAFRLQPTLSNGRRPDCIVHIPGTDRGIVVDAKFPLEGFEALRVATTPEETKAAERLVREHVGRHIDDIAQKYLIPGETADTALMFVPAESVYADLHERFHDLIQKSHRANVAIVSPNLLMLAIQTMQMILKDARVRENADAIQREVGLLVEDVGRLRLRLADLDRHFKAAAQDLERAGLSAEKVMSRGSRIGAIEIGDEVGAGDTSASSEPDSRVRAVGESRSR